MNHDLVVSLVALALIGVCAWFVISSAASDEERVRRTSQRSERRVAKEAGRSEAAARRAEQATGAAERRAEKTAAAEQRRAVLAARAEQRRAERAAYAEKRRAERAARAAEAGRREAEGARSAEIAAVATQPEVDLASRLGVGLPEADTIDDRPTVEWPPPAPSRNGQGLGPAVAMPAAAAKSSVDAPTIGYSFGPAVADPSAARVAPAPTVAPAPVVSVAAATEPAGSVATAARGRPRIFTGEPAPLEHGPPVSKRALKLLGGMTALAAVGAVGLLAVVRAVAAMFGR
jgi:hypothetical protein